ncbi:hypothetical protein LUW77_04275 [Streptomyces radiopugnans]|nr:hypothetical protein LUW77_04275 [Streptomyces radiopugnans]
MDTAPDEIGTPFTVVVNGRPVFVKGANWIPDDHFLTRITRERIERRVDQAVGAHMNLLRVWGGGIYETEDFYDVCDERGVLVWQDFPFACASYPEEEPLWSEIEAEARENVARLTPHPSLALWNGANENMWGFRDWGWPEQLQGRTWGLRYYTELLPSIVAELDPTRFYCANSPYSPGAPIDGTHPNDQDHGTRHEWEVWNRVDYTRYRDHIPRFCSEFGFQGPPTWATLTQWIHDEPMTPTSSALPAAPEGRGGQRQARPRHGTPPARAEDLRGLALGDPAQPGPRGRLRHRALPLLVAADGRGGRLAAQRLLAGHLLGGGGRRRAAQAAVVRAAPRLRAPAADRPAPRRPTRPDRGQRPRRAVEGRAAPGTADLRGHRTAER